MLPEQVVQITVTETPVSVNVVSPDASSSFAYHHVQGVASTMWDVVHGLGFFPNVTTMDSGGSTVQGELEHFSRNHLRVTFSAPISGNAFLS